MAFLRIVIPLLTLCFVRDLSENRFPPRIKSEGRLFRDYVSSSFTLAEDRRADPNMGRTKLDRGPEIRAHPHGKQLPIVALGNLGRQRKVCSGWFTGRGNAHQTGNGEPVALPAGP